MAGTNSEIRDLNSATQQQQDMQSSSSSVNNEDSDCMNFQEFLEGMFLADEGTSSNPQLGQCLSDIHKLLRTLKVDEVCSDSNYQSQMKNPASPEALENMTLEDYMDRFFTDDVQKPPPPPQQTRYAKGIMERRQLRMAKNKELAAQFRANKQRYNIQLEEELYRLREENKRLRLRMKHNEELSRAKCNDATQSE